MSYSGEAASPMGGSWACACCTLVNPATEPCCRACEAPRASSSVQTVSAASAAGSSMEERRQARYVKRPSWACEQRIERALEQRLYLLNVERHPDGVGATFAVLGSTGNVYTVELAQKPTCNCPDALKGRGLCKHVLFIWLRVLRCQETDPRIWQTALLTAELRSALAPLFQRRRARRLPFATMAARDAFLRASSGGADPVGQTRVGSGSGGHWMVMTARFASRP